MSTARKFVDADLRLNPDLISVAVKYVEQYKGEFGFLLDARQVVMDTGSLPLPVARGVLNCMRVDPTVIGLDKLQRAENHVVTQPEHPHEHRDLHVVDDEPEPATRVWDLRTPATVKVPYVHSKQRRAVLHRVGVGFLRGGGPYRQHTNAFFSRAFHRDKWYGNQTKSDLRTEISFQVYRQCLWQPLLNPELVAERPEGMSYCRSGCFSWHCNNCKKRSTLPDYAEPTATIAACEWCRSQDIRPEFNPLSPQKQLEQRETFNVY